MEINSQTIRETDLDKFANGTSTNLWEVLGAQVIDGNTRFSVWAPNAVEVTVNNYSLHPTKYGVWETTIPEDLTGLHYSYNLKLVNGETLVKFDPMSLSNEVHPNRKSIIYKSNYTWNDSEWISNRRNFSLIDSPVTVYEVHVHSWKSGKTYRDLATELVAYVKDLGFTHVQLMPVADYPFIPSWGYQITGFYAPSAYYGEPDDLRFFIDSCHQAGIGVILDWVGYHFARDDFGLAKYDGTSLYSMPEDTPEQVNNLWGTDIFDFSKPEVQSFLVSNVIYWAKEFHIDGFRIDAVAPMINKNARDIHNEKPEKIPDWDGVRIIRSINDLIHSFFPGVFTIGEETQGWPTLTSPTTHLPMGMGFDLKFFHDASWGWGVHFLPYERIDTRFTYEHLMELMTRVFEEKHIWLISHDEVFHGCKGSMQKHMVMWRTSEFAAKLLPTYLMFMLSAPGKALFFMGSELNSEKLWEPLSELDWYPEASVRSPEILRNAMKTHKATPELYRNDFSPSGLTMVIADKPKDKVVAFLRSFNNEETLCVYNFSIESHSQYEIPGMQGVLLKEIANSTTEPFIETSAGILDLPDGSARWFKVYRQQVLPV